MRSALERVSRSRGCGPRRRRQRRWRPVNTLAPGRVWAATGTGHTGRGCLGLAPLAAWKARDYGAMDLVSGAETRTAIRPTPGRTAFDEQHAALQWSSALPVQADESREVAFGEAVAVPGCRHAPVPLTNADGLQANSPGTLTIPTNRHAGVRTNLTRSRGAERWPFNDDRAFQCCVAWGTFFLNLLLRQQK
jgi:hypothetical protein